MNLATWIIFALFSVYFALAVRHVVRHGACSECGKGGCGGHCAHCRGRCPVARAAGILASQRETPRAEDKP